MNSPIGIPSLADLYTQPFVVIGQDQRVRLVDRAVEEVYGIAWEPAAGGVMPGELVQVDEPADATAATATPGPDAGLRMVGGPGRSVGFSASRSRPSLRGRRP